jgi:hypothetical protein
MKTNKKIGTFLITIAFILIIDISSGHSYQTITIQGKSDIHWPEVKRDFLQEKSKYQYVGAAKCASFCHNNEKMGFQYKIWKSSLHSGAFKILVSKRAEKYAKKAHVKENPQESSACLKCHVTGGELNTSYYTATYKKEEGVTCEACHKQKFDGKTYLPNEADCLKCHNDSLHKMHKFNFKGKCAKIAHHRPTEIPPGNHSTDQLQ